MAAANEAMLRAYMRRDQEAALLRDDPEEHGRRMRDEATERGQASQAGRADVGLPRGASLGGMRRDQEAALLRDDPEEHSRRMREQKAAWCSKKKPNPGDALIRAFCTVCGDPVEKWVKPIPDRPLTFSFWHCGKTHQRRAGGKHHVEVLNTCPDPEA